MHASCGVSPAAIISQDDAGAIIMIMRAQSFMPTLMCAEVSEQYTARVRLHATIAMVATLIAGITMTMM